MAYECKSKSTTFNTQQVALSTRKPQRSLIYSFIQAHISTNVLTNTMVCFRILPIIPTTVVTTWDATSDDTKLASWQLLFTMTRVTSKRNHGTIRYKRISNVSIQGSVNILAAEGARPWQVTFYMMTSSNGIHRGQWCGALMFSLICAWRNGWVNNRQTGDLRPNCAHYDVIVMSLKSYARIFCRLLMVVRL